MKILELFEAMQPEQVLGKETSGSVEALEKRLLAAKKEGTKFTYDVIDQMMQKICSEYNLTGQKLHDKFVDKHHLWPDNWIKKQNIAESQKFTTMQQVKDYFKRIGKTEAQAAAAWARGYRGPKVKEVKPYDPSKNKNLWYNKDDNDVDETIKTYVGIKGQQGVAEGFSNDMSTEDMIAYLRQHHDTNLHQDYLDHINTFSKFVLKDIPVNSIKTDLPKLDRAKVEQYKQMDFSKAPPIVVGNGYILDGYHRANVAKVLGIPTIRAYVGVQSQQGIAEGSEQSLSSMVSQDQAERNEYQQFVKSQAGNDWTKGAKMYAQLKKRPANDIFDDASRLNQFMKMTFDFDKFTNADWDNYWLLAQHCDSNRAFQKQALSTIKKYQGTDHSHYKYLYDRISVGLTGKQKYGTQNIQTQQNIKETVNADMFQGSWKKTEHRDGLDLEAEASKKGLSIRVYDATGRLIGQAHFDIEGDHLESFDTYVDPSYRRQGIATAMYNWAKELGNDIVASTSRTTDGRKFWKGSRPGTKTWEDHEI